MRTSDWFVRADRLKPDEFYITVGNGAGLTNQIFGIIDGELLSLSPLLPCLVAAC